MKTIAIINFKGGVGKTTMTWCLGDMLSQREGSNVLLFDLDAQMSMTQSISLAHGGKFNEWQEQSSAKEKTIFKVLQQFLEIGHFDFHPDEEFIYMLNNNYHFVSATEELYWLELETLDPGKGKFFIRDVLGHINNSRALPNYDYVLFDCPPSFTILSYSVMSCCDLILVPVNPNFFAAKGIDTLLTVLKKKIMPHPLPTIAIFVNRVQESHQRIPPNWNWGMAPTRAEKKWIEDIRKVCDEAKDRLGIDVHCLDAYIQNRVAIRDAITSREIPRKHFNDFVNLWEESEDTLQ